MRLLFLTGVSGMLVRGMSDGGMHGAEVSEACCSGESDEGLFVFFTGLARTLLLRELATGETEGVMW